jgi:transposase InsO family protein
VAHLNIAGTFYYLCSILDGFSRAVVHWEIREAMREAEIETILRRGRERHPEPSLGSSPTRRLSSSPVTSKKVCRGTECRAWLRARVSCAWRA